jgi:hypothetical protein
VGSFAGPATGYAPHLGIISPTDNDITPDSTLAAADQLRLQQEALFEDLRNQVLAQRVNRPTPR